MTAWRRLRSFLLSVSGALWHVPRLFPRPRAPVPCARRSGIRDSAAGQGACNDNGTAPVPGRAAGPSVCEEIGKDVPHDVVTRDAALGQLGIAERLQAQNPVVPVLGAPSSVRRRARDGRRKPVIGAKTRNGCGA